MILSGLPYQADAYKLYYGCRPMRKAINTKYRVLVGPEDCGYDFEAIMRIGMLTSVSPVRDE